MPELPLVEGLTQTGPESDPVHIRLMRFLAQRPGGSQQDLAEGLAALQRAYAAESDDTVRRRLAAAIALARGESDEA